MSWIGDRCEALFYREVNFDAITHLSLGTRLRIRNRGSHNTNTSRKGSTEVQRPLGLASRTVVNIEPSYPALPVITALHMGSERGDIQVKVARWAR